MEEKKEEEFKGVPGNARNGVEKNVKKEEV